MPDDDEDPLFSHALGDGISPSEPLAHRMRPRTLDAFIGQEHIVGPGRLLRRAIQKDRLSSIILSGPPGTGKTTLARVIANGTSSRFVTLNAVLAGVADIRSAIEEARKHRELYDRRTILFVDEVHRWNKAQQDALLPWVENGTLILVGATTENPFFEVNRALVSRSRVFQLRALGSSELRRVAEAAVADRERGYGRWRLTFAEGALEHLVDVADGDARSLLNALELAIETSAEPWPPAEGSEILVDMRAAEESIQRRAVLYDKDGDYHYDAASAFIKSLRGSDPDAALYWLSRMIYAGESPRFAFRRMLISACEDVGLADPAALGLVLACAEAFERVGLPEGQFHLAQAALYLATAPKSNSALGYFDALAAVESEPAEVPGHLRDANRDAKGFGHGEGYLYPHAFRDHWVAQQYLPSALRGRVFYAPGTEGREGQLRPAVLERREAQVAAAFEEAAAEGGEGSWSKAGERKAEWRARAESGTPARLAFVRRALYETANPGRSDRVLVLEARQGYLVWEALRRSPEGTVAAAVRDEGEKSVVEGCAATLGEMEAPLCAVLPLARITRPALEAAFGFSAFELAVGSGLLRSEPDPAALLASLGSALGGTRLAWAELLPREGGRLSSIAGAFLGEELARRLAAFEEGFYARADLGALGPSRESLIAAIRGFPGEGFKLEVKKGSFRRSLSPAEVGSWLAPTSTYGAALAAEFQPEEVARVAWAAEEGARSGPKDWPVAALIVSGMLG